MWTLSFAISSESTNPIVFNICSSVIFQLISRHFHYFCLFSVIRLVFFFLLLPARLFVLEHLHEEGEVCIPRIHGNQKRSWGLPLYHLHTLWCRVSPSKPSPRNFPTSASLGAWIIGICVNAQLVVWMLRPKLLSSRLGSRCLNHGAISSAPFFFSNLLFCSIFSLNDDNDKKSTLFPWKTNFTIWLDESFLCPSKCGETLA